MKSIDLEQVQQYLNQFLNQDLYYHLETSNGSYASLADDQQMSVCAFIRNGRIRYSRGIIVGPGPYRVGLKMEEGWVYAEGLTDYEMNGQDQLLLGGYDHEGRINIALELSLRPFSIQ
ncbi:YojF family protein [Neobacillus drentensis]|uniref:YojF family protein n=1 Tax=Neobacillus drentensis TaxID=220684 RepID=UPI003000481E